MSNMIFQKINENSLQQLSAVLEAQQSRKRITISSLPFYLRQKDMPEGKLFIARYCCSVCTNRA